jgi:hypothetical protein
VAGASYQNPSKLSQRIVKVSGNFLKVHTFVKIEEVLVETNDFPANGEESGEKSTAPLFSFQLFQIT